MYAILPIYPNIKDIHTLYLYRMSLYMNRFSLEEIFTPINFFIVL